MDLKNKVILVTGGSSGLGEAIVRKCAEYGAKVVFLYIGETDNAEKIVKEVESEAFVVDVTNAEECEKITKEIASKYGRVDALVNNAGIIAKAEMSDEGFNELWDKVINVNLNGARNMTRAIIPYMKKAKSGRIVNISSIHSIAGKSSSAAYAVSKAGIDSLTRVSAGELAEYGITVNSIGPGPIMTPHQEKKGGDKLARKEAIIPLQRLGKPEEIAGPVVFLLSDLASYITGQTIFVDGGLLINQYNC